MNGLAHKQSMKQFDLWLVKRKCDSSATKHEIKLIANFRLTLQSYPEMESCSHTNPNAVNDIHHINKYIGILCEKTD